MLGHTLGLYCNKRQDHEKVSETVDNGPTHQVHKANKPVVNEKWMAKSIDTKKRSGSISKDTDKTLPQVEILRRPTHGVTDDNRIALANAGLLSESETSSSRQVPKQDRSMGMEDSQFTHHDTQDPIINTSVRDEGIAIAFMSDKNDSTHIHDYLHRKKSSTS